MPNIQSEDTFQRHRIVIDLSGQNKRRARKKEGEWEKQFSNKKQTLEILHQAHSTSPFDVAHHYTN
jgi:hypothetical protein